MKGTTMGCPAGMERPATCFECIINLIKKGGLAESGLMRRS